MLAFADRVQETTNTVGTGTINLNGPTDGRVSFADSIPDGSRCRYLIISSDDQWEIGEGILTNGFPPTLSRNVIKSSLANDLLSLPSGTHYVSQIADASSFNNFIKYESKIISTSQTIAKGDHVLVASAGLTVTLPASPKEGWHILVSVLGFTNTVIGRNGEPIMGLTENMTIDIENTTIELRYADATRGWMIV